MLYSISFMLVNELDAIDKEILNDIQWSFPLVKRPFLEMANKYQLKEEEVLNRTQRLKDIGIIRQISAIFDTRKLGYKSALVAFSVEKKTEKISEVDKEYIRQLQKDIEIIREPFKTITDNLGINLEELFNKVKEYQNIGIMRRFAAILRHRQAGFTANGMIVWNVPEEKIDQIGSKIASFPQVSHCYRRPIYPDWEFNLFSMIHARTIDAAEKIAKEISAIIKIDRYRILFSSREFKKERVKYF